MKTQLKLILFVLAITTAISTTCKAQPGKTRKVLDSLKITDGDEIKVCTLYDDVVTEYINQMKQFAAGKTKLSAAESADLNKKYQVRVKEIQPQVDNLKNKLRANMQELMKFVQFSNYEAMRVYSGVSLYQNGIYKNYGLPANH